MQNVPDQTKSKFSDCGTKFLLTFAEQHSYPTANSKLFKETFAFVCLFFCFIISKVLTRRKYFLVIVEKTTKLRKLRKSLAEK